MDGMVMDAMAKGGHAFDRFVAICPTGVFGPMLQSGVNATMGWIASLAKGSKEQAANDSMSFIDVRDCAAHHVDHFPNPPPGQPQRTVVRAQHLCSVVPAEAEVRAPGRLLHRPFPEVLELGKVT